MSGIKKELTICWVGFHVEGIRTLEAVLEKGYRVGAVLTLDEAGVAKRCAGTDYSALCGKHGIPLHGIGHINDEAALSVLREIQPDVTFVIGWSQIVGPEALRAAKIGTVGAHASLLPHNRGSAPVNWALLNGEKTTGNTLMWLNEGLDSGDIIFQTEFPITEYDTCATLYEKVAASNTEMTLRLLGELCEGRRPGSPQPETDEPPLPRRKPADGLLNWTKDCAQVYNFIRALAKPYPGAFSYMDGVKWKIWESALMPCGGGEPGVVTGPVYSPRDGACGQLVACGGGSVIVLAAENTETGVLYEGRSLSDLEWKGRKLTDE